MLRSWLFVCDVVIKWWNLSEAESSGRKIAYSQIRLERDIGTTPLSWPPVYHRRGLSLSWCCSTWNFLSWSSTIHPDLSSPAFEASIRMALYVLLTAFNRSPSSKFPSPTCLHSTIRLGPLQQQDLSEIVTLNCLKWGAGAAVTVTV